eukprot:1792381-Amphidinium_carterae.1
MPQTMWVVSELEEERRSLIRFNHLPKPTQASTEEVIDWQAMQASMPTSTRLDNSSNAADNRIT